MKEYENMLENAFTYKSNKPAPAPFVPEMAKEVQIEEETKKYNTKNSVEIVPKPDITAFIQASTWGQGNIPQTSKGAITATAGQGIAQSMSTDEPGWAAL